MRPTPYRRLAAFALLVGLAPSWTAGQTAPSLEELEVALWPEYDRQAVLVMYRFRLAPGTLLPARVGIPIPAGVGEPHAVAWRDQDGSLKVAEFERTDQEDRATILMTLRGLEGQLEFYQDLEFEDQQRRFGFIWPGGVAVSAFLFNVQQPLGATDLTVTPEPQERSPGPDGLTYAAVRLGAIDATARPELTLSYRKASAELTASAFSSPPPAAAAPSGPSGTATSGGDSRLPWVFVVSLAVALGVAVSWSLRSSRRQVQAAPAPRGRGAAKRPAPGKGRPAAGPKYCFNCGQATGADDVFCAACGVRLRS